MCPPLHSAVPSAVGGAARSAGTGAAPVGIVLAGGGSTRMGRDKALLQLNGQSLVARAAETLARLCSTVAIADRGRGYLTAYPSLADGPGAGPAAGLLGAARAYPQRPLLALACDLPYVPDALLQWLAGEQAALALPRRDGRLEPLVACYHPPALAVLERRVAHGRLALHELATELVDDPTLTVRLLEGDALAVFGPPAETLRNLNRPEDLPG